MTPSLHIKGFDHIRTIIADRSSPEHAHAFAELYWHALLLAGVGAVAAASIAGAVLFSDALALGNASTLTSGAAPASSAIDRSALSATLAAFAARQAAFEALQAGAMSGTASTPNAH